MWHLFTYVNEHACKHNGKMTEIVYLQWGPKVWDHIENLKYCHVNLEVWGFRKLIEVSEVRSNDVILSKEGLSQHQIMIDQRLLRGQCM